MNSCSEGAAGSAPRVYRLSDDSGEGHVYEVVSEAWPSADLRLLERRRQRMGSSDGQQAWKALAILCAWWLWTSEWRQRQIRLRVCSGSDIALIIVLRTKAKGRRPAPASRDLALDVSEVSHEPKVS